VELLQNLLALIRGNGSERRHLLGEPLDLGLRQVAEHLGGRLFTEHQGDDGGFPRA
jgi:hypothetical protein